MRRGLITTLTSLSLLTACGTATPVAAPATGMPTSQSDLSIQAHGGRIVRLAKKLGLTDEQRDKIKAIIRRHRCDEGAMAAEAEAVHSHLLAANVNVVQLTESLQSVATLTKAKLEQKIAMLGEIRDVLTDDQRAKLAEIRKGRAVRPGTKMLERLTRELQLNPEQQRAFSHVFDAYAATRAERRATRRARHRAIIDFMISGNKEALAAALQAAQHRIPAAVIAQAMASLSPEQRQKLVDTMKQQKARRCDATEGTTETKPEPAPKAKAGMSTQAVGDDESTEEAETD